jgi:outer membrane protein TolC
VSERNVLAVQKRVLASLLGISGAEQPITLEGSLTLPEEGPTPSLKANLATALRQRPDYLAARAALEAQARKVDAARAARYPTIALQGTYGGRWGPDPSQRPAGANEADDVGSVGIVVDVPVFEGGRIDAAIREQKAQLESDRQRLRELELRIDLDVETATLNVASARERFLAAEKAVEQAKESLRIEREKYDLGKGAIVDVLDVQSALLDSQTNYYRALAEYHTAVAQRRLAVGEEP